MKSHRRSWLVVASTAAMALTTGSLMAVVPTTAAAATYPTRAADQFSRSVAGGWGSAESGGAYSVNKAAGMSVDGTRALMAIPKGADRWAVLPAVDSQDVELTATLQFATVPTAGNGVFVGPMLRRTTAGAFYLPRVRVTPDKKARLSLLYVNGATVTTLAAETALPFTVSAGTKIALRAQAQGLRSTTLRARAWVAGTAEPTTWLRTGTATTISTPGSVGFWGYVSSSSPDAQVYVDDLKVTSLVPVNAPPNAAFTAATNDLTVDVDGSNCADPDGTIASYQWDFGDGSNAAGKNPPAHTYAAAGTYTVRLTVTDDSGATDSTTKSVTAVAPNVAPTAAFTAAADDLTVTVNGSGSADSDGSIASYQWTFGDGTSATGRTPAAHAYDSPGTYSVTLTVTDNKGATDTATKSVTATAPNAAPTAAFASSVTNLAVTVNGSGSADSDGSIASYAWNFGDGSTATGKTPAAHAYQAAGTYTVTLTVTDDKGAIDTATKSVTVVAPANVRPTAAFASSVTNLAVTVDGSGSADSDGSIASYAWNFGDGSTATGKNPPAHTYAAAGTYTVTLTVTDDKGATGTATKSVSVTAPPPPPAAATPGAQLPLNYSIGSLSGPVLYVAKNGSDANAGTVAAPLATVAAAISKAASGTNVVVRGGTYTEANLVIPASKAITIVSYPGEHVTFSGAQSFDSGWTAEGGLVYHAYAAQPVNYGSGLNDGGGFAKPVAQYPDQVWQGNRTLVQVLSKAEVAVGKFFVDTANGRVYVAAADQAAGSIKASSKAKFLRILGSNSSVRGVRIERYSNSLADYGVIRIEHTTDRTVPLSNILLEDVEIIGSAMQAVQVLVADAAGGSRTYPGDIIDGVTFRNVTIADSNWMGIAANYTDHLMLDQVKITTSNLPGEFRSSPQSGALKTSRDRYITVKDSLIANNNSHALWFDQSNYDTVVANNIITGNNGSAVFWEISDKLLMANNYVNSPVAGAQAVKIAGASGVRVINNTFVGGKDTVGIYTDNRSKPGCADSSQPLCASSYGSDRDTIRPRPATMDWMPRIDQMINNVIVHPNGSMYCGGTASVCVTTSNAGAVAPLESIFHQADAARGIPKTVVNGNVYANGTGAIVRAGSVFTDLTAWKSALTGSPYNLAGSEAAGKSGASWVNSDGTSTAALKAVEAQAVPVPTEAVLNQFVPAGHRYYGQLGK